MNARREELLRKKKAQFTGGGPERCEVWNPLEDLKNPKLWIFYAFTWIHELSGIEEAGASVIQSNWWEPRGVRRWLEICCSCLPKHPVVTGSQPCHCYSNLCSDKRTSIW
jgi:hypothetical protein